MLRDCDPERKTSVRPCPKCGAAGNYSGHGGYERWLDDGSGARRVRVNRVKCLSVSVNIFFTNFAKILSPYPPTLFRQTCQRTFTTSG